MKCTGKSVMLLSGAVVIVLSCSTWLHVATLKAQQTSAAQQVTGTPGSPGATTTIDGQQIPPMPQPFGGRIERNAAQSTPYWPARVVPPKGAPILFPFIAGDNDPRFCRCAAHELHGDGMACIAEQLLTFAQYDGAEERRSMRFASRSGG